MQSKHQICIHGHFYQPPRENPWLEVIETQEGAAPYHDWNERVHAECYAQNVASRLLREHGLIRDIRNNYEEISFNFGPTLLSWMEKSDPDAYNGIIQADRDSVRRNEGHGNAIAQVYNHIIMPLANDRDKRTQVLWGVRDFQYRFGRDPEGMWLAETAVDLASLESLASANIKFTILAPHQAKRFRRLGEDKWHPGSEIDVGRSYICKLPSGKSISIFFYDGHLAQDVAFKDLLKDGVMFAKRLANFTGESDDDFLTHFATDGETYGHHHRFGDMALAFALNYIRENNLSEITNYSAYLSEHPPTWEVEIVENSSWSCVHGIERWRSDCGCSLSRDASWNQKWRTGLRDSLSWLQSNLDELFERIGAELLNDPWQARDDYISVILDRNDESVLKFIENHNQGATNTESNIKRLQLLEMQRQCMLMFTSCGWFFDELSEVQTVQVIQYAGRAIQLAKNAGKAEFEDEFLARLSEAKSNLPDEGDGALIYRKNVKPLQTDIKRVGAHYAVMSLFEDFPADASIYCFDVKQIRMNSATAGRIKLITGEIHIKSRITWREQHMGIAALHIGGFDFSGGVSVLPDSADWIEFERLAMEFFDKGDMTSVISRFDNYFNSNRIGFEDLFSEDRRKIAGLILDETVEKADEAFEGVYADNAGVIRYIARLGLPIPTALKSAADRALKRAVLDELERTPPSEIRLNELQNEADVAGIALLDWRIEPALSTCINRLAGLLNDMHLTTEMLAKLAPSISGIKRLKMDINLWRLQNAYYNRKSSLTEVDRADEEFITAFGKLGYELHFEV